MRLREVKIENFRKFREPVEITEIGDGLNLICDANEAGKSTVLEAIRAALFERHGAKSEKIKSFRPHGDEVAPKVRVVFEVDGESWTVEKQFLQHPSVSLIGGGRRFQSDEAEEQLQTLLGFSRAGNRGADDDTRGALGLLWVEQGQSFVLGAPGQTARRTLEEVLAGEVGTVTGGRRTTAVVQAVDRALAELMTATGRPTRRLSEAQQRAADAERALAAAQAELRQFDEVLERLEAKRAEQRRVLRDLDDDEAANADQAVREQLDRARLAAEQLRSASLVLERANGAVAATQARLDERRAARATAERLSQDYDGAELAAADTAQAVAAVREEADQRADDLRQAREGLSKAEQTRNDARLAELARQRVQALVAAFARLDRAEGLAAEIVEAERVLDKAQVDAAALQRLDAIERRVIETRSAAEAGAASLQVSLTTGGPEVRLDGKPIQSDLHLTLTKAVALDVDDAAHIVFTPPVTGEAALRKVQDAQQDLDDFLRQISCSSSEVARQTAHQRSEAEIVLKSLRPRLSTECSADAILKIAPGLEALRAALSNFDRPSVETPADVPTVSTVEAAEAEYQARREIEQEAVGRREAAAEALQKAQLDEVALNAARETARAARDRHVQSFLLAEQGASDAVLESALAGAVVDQTTSNAAFVAAQRAAEGLDVAALERKLQTQARRRKSLQDARLELAQTIARLEEQARSLGGAGPAARVAAAIEAESAARGALDSISEEAAVLSLLKQTLEEAKSRAAQRYLAPITQRVEPYVRRLLPAASLSFGEDLRPDQLSRYGRSESAENLSKGTQEQIAVLTRLAFADLLLSKGKPASLMLDDALVFADDDRFETMIEILLEAAERMQLIVFSCRASAYRHVPATRLTLRGQAV